MKRYGKIKQSNKEKNMWKRLFLTVSILCTSVLICGCGCSSEDCSKCLDALGSTTWTFDNWSSVTVSVTDIEGGSPSSLTISPWGKETSSVSGNTISFSYSPSNKVYASRVDGEEKYRFFSY